MAIYEKDTGVTYEDGAHGTSIPSFIGASTDTKPTVASHSGVSCPVPFSEFYAYNTGITYITYDGTNWVQKKSELAATQVVTATSASPLTDGTLFTFYGTVGLISLTGRVTDAHPAAPNACHIDITCDALADYAICTSKDLTGLGVGTLISITGTAADAMIATTVVGAIAPGQASMIVATCVTSGIIKVTYADTGNQAAAIVWELLWIPLSSTGLVV